MLVRPTGGTSTSLIYSDIQGTGSKANPMTADSLGRFSFYAANGRYDLLVTATGIGTATVVDVSMEDVPLSNLNELTTASAARSNIGAMSTASNLSDLANASTARANLGVAIGTDVQAYDAAIPKTTATQSWTKAQRGAVVALTSTDSSIAVDLSLGNNFSHAVTEQTTMAAGTNAQPGQGGTIVITQAATAKTMAFNSFWKWAGTATGTLSTATGATDMMVYHVYSTSAAACQMINNLA